MLCSFLSSALQGEQEIRRRDGLNQGVGGGKNSRYPPSRCLLGPTASLGAMEDSKIYMPLPGIDHRIASSSTSHSIIRG